MHHLIKNYQRHACDYNRVTWSLSLLPLSFTPVLSLCPPLLFPQATMLPAEFKAGKLQAYKLICEMMTRNQDVLPNSDFLVHLYHVMHKGFTSVDQVIFCAVLSFSCVHVLFLM